MLERLTQPDRRGRLAFAQRGRRDGAHHDVLRGGAILHGGHRVETDLGGPPPVGLQAVVGNAGGGGDVGERFEGGAFGDLEIRGEGHEVGAPVW